MDNLPDIGGNLEDIITQTLARRRKRMADVSPEWGVDLSPEQVGTTAGGEPITMDAPTVRRTEDLPPGFVRDGARMTGPSGAFTELGTPRVVRKTPGVMARTEVAADGDESSPLMAQLMAVKGLGEVMTPESVQAAKQAYAARGGEFARGTLPTVEAAKAGEDARQRDLMERLERQAQGAADTSKATSSDGPPDTEPLYRQAFLEQLRNVGRAARGEQTVRVASPELAARDELAKWLASKQEREAGAAKLAQQERLEQMRALLGLAREEAATGRTKMQTEADVKRAEIAAGAKAAPKGVGKPAVAPKPAKLPPPEFKSDKVPFGDEELTAEFPPEFPKELKLDSAKKAREAAGKWATTLEGLNQLESALRRFAQNPTAANAKLLEGPALSAAGATNAALGQGAMSQDEKRAQFDALGINMMDVDQFRNIVKSALGNKQAAEAMLARVQQMKGLARNSVAAQVHGSGYKFGAKAAGEAEGDVVLVDKSDGMETTVPKSEADDYVKADPARFSIKGG